MPDRLGEKHFGKETQEGGNGCHRQPHGTPVLGGGKQKPVTPASAKPVPVFDVFLRRQTNKGAEVRPHHGHARNAAFANAVMTINRSNKNVQRFLLLIT